MVAPIGTTVLLMPDPHSPLHAALSMVGDRWTLLVIDALLGGPRRFGDLQTERPPRYEYTLTSSGKELAGAINLLAAWGSAHSDEAEPPRHGLCGTPLEVRWYCPTCDREASEADQAWDV